MVEARLRYVKSVIDRYGHTRYYFRVGRDYHRITGTPSTAEFIRSYNLLLAQHYTGALKRKRRAPGKREFVVPGTLHWIAIEYLKSNQYNSFAPSTQSTYRRALDAISGSALGRLQVSRVSPEEIECHCAQIARERGDAASDLQLRLVSSLWKFSRSFPDHAAKGRQNPTLGLPTRYRVSRPHQPWPEWVQREFLRSASEPLRLAYYLLLFTAQRRSDVIRLRWIDFDGNHIDLKQLKTGEPMSLYVHSTLRAALDVASRLNEIILVDERGRPYSPERLTRAIKSVLRSIGASDYTLHGLRKSAAVALAYLGCGEYEIMAVLGHRTPKMARYYVEQANRRKLSQNAIRTWEAASATLMDTRSPTGSTVAAGAYR